MGIPAFAKAITRQYPHIIVNQLHQNCSRLFLDLNCAIHMCAQKSLENFQSKASYEKSIVNETIAYINTLCNYTKPQQLLFIAIDGIPPRAKMQQQRKRRYMTSWRKSQIQQKTGIIPLWDSNAITPGTDFMNTLANNLESYFTNNKFSYRVVLSDSNMPGEGEAKIMSYIRDHPSNGGADVVYGLDADLVMLSLAALRYSSAIYLLREASAYGNNTSNRPFLYFDIRALYSGIEHDFGNVYDYIVLCFLLGNDFLPPLSYLKISQGGIELLKLAYLSSVGSIVHKHDNDSNMQLQLNYSKITRILEYLSNKENELMSEAERAYYGNKTFKPRSLKSPLEHAEFELDHYPSLQPKAKSVQPLKGGWRPRYYNQLFKTVDTQDINGVCMNYLEGLQWTFDYYFSGTCSLMWYYNYEYSPSAMDLYTLVSTLEVDGSASQIVTKSILSNYPHVDFDTDLQLLCVLPPSSKHLLHQTLQCIPSDIAHGCVHMYPLGFHINTYLKSFLWECHPALPPINVLKLRNAKEKLMTNKDIHGN